MTGHVRPESSVTFTGIRKKSFNISKSDKSMWAFLQEVHEFRNEETQRHEWEAALSLSKTLTEPDGSKLGDIKRAIQTRDNLIRKDLVDFIAGNKHRVDEL